MDSAEMAIITLNLVLGFGCACPLARHLVRLKGRSSKTWQIYVGLVGVYFIECVAFTAGMATNVFTIGLSFLWGTIFGFWISRVESSAGKLLKAAFFFSLYTCLPAVSVLSLPLILSVSGWPVFTSEAGLRLGIPGYVPWPYNTIFGFFLIVGLSALVFKTIISTGEVSLILHFRNRKDGHITTR